MGPTSREGSSTTADPVQGSRVGTPTLVVLNPPGPAKTRAWAGPVRQAGGAGRGGRGGQADVGFFDPAGAGEEGGRGGAGAAGVDEQRRRAALAPGAGLGGMEGAAVCAGVVIAAVGFTNDDPAV